MQPTPPLKHSVALACLLPGQLVLAGFQDETQHAQSAEEHVGQVAHQAHEEVGAIPNVKQGLATGITAVIVFFIVLAVLQVKVWPIITKGLDERAAKIRDEIAAAEEARKQAAEALESYQQSLAQARAEAQAMLEETKAQQATLAAELKAKADKELAEMRDKARRDIETARRAALNDIYAQSATLATQIASKILAREVSTEDNQRLVDESLAQLANS